MKNSTRLLSSIFLIALCCFFQFAKAQIVYTDVNPDQTCSGNSTYHLDLNNDGVTDFILKGKKYSTSCVGECRGGVTLYSVEISPNLGNSVAVLIYPYYPSKLESGDQIDSSLIFSTSGDQFLVKENPFCGLGYCKKLGSGGWIAATNKYLGLQIKIGSEYYFGWARLNVTSTGTSFTIKDYAYNSIANQLIFAGQTCPPQAAIAANGPTTFCAGDSVMLSSSNTGTNLSYKWKLNGSNISGATNKSFTVKIAGNYKVNVKDNTNGCSATSAWVKVKVPCKVIEENLNQDAYNLSVYPNPLSAATTISFSLPQSENVWLKIYDLQGRLIRTLASESMTEGEHMITWNAHDENRKEVSAGIYLLKLQTARETETIRLSVVK